jgi:hypothetical protein
MGKPEAAAEAKSERVDQVGSLNHKGFLYRNNNHYSYLLAPLAQW